MRLFIAIPVPEDLQHALHKAVLPFTLDSGRLKMSVVAPQNIHLTLAFLGEIPEETVPDITEAMDETAAAIPAWTAAVRGLETFGRPGRPRILWAGIEETNQQSIRCRQRLIAALKCKEIATEEKKFHPHLTLARIKYIRKGHELTSKVQLATNTCYGDMEVHSLKLYRSQLTPRGAEYTTLHESALIKGDINHG